MPIVDNRQLSAKALSAKAKELARVLDEMLELARAADSNHPATIITPYLQEWRKTGKKPNPKKFGFHDDRDVLEKAEIILTIMGNTIGGVHDKLNKRGRLVILYKDDGGIIRRNLGMDLGGYIIEANNIMDFEYTIDVTGDSVAESYFQGKHRYATKLPFVKMDFLLTGDYDNFMIERK